MITKEVLFAEESHRIQLKAAGIATQYVPKILRMNLYLHALFLGGNGSKSELKTPQIIDLSAAFFLLYLSSVALATRRMMPCSKASQYFKKICISVTIHMLYYVAFKPSLSIYTVPFEHEYCS